MADEATVASCDIDATLLVPQGDTAEEPPIPNVLAGAQGAEFNAGATRTDNSAGASPGEPVQPWSYRRLSGGDCLVTEIAKTPEMSANCDALAKLEAGAPECADGEVVLTLLYRAKSGTTEWVNINAGQCIGPSELATAAESAWSTLKLTPTPANVHPPNGWTIVHFDTIVHTTQEPQQLESELLGIPVEIRATPDEYAWGFGDGSTVTTTDPGQPYPDHTLVHQYTALKTYTITLTTTWSGQFRITGAGSWTTIEGTATTTDSADPLGQY